MNLSHMGIARPTASVNLLTELEYRRLKAAAFALQLHDVDINIETLAALLSKILVRTIGTDTAVQVVTEYNERLRKEYA